MTRKKINETQRQHLLKLEAWRKDAFYFAEDALGMRASEPIDELRGKPIKYKDAYGNEHTTILFDDSGRLVYHDLSFYSVDMFKNQGKKLFRSRYRGSRLTWQQTVELEAYQRGIDTFDKDNFNLASRWITIRSGHGIGKTSFLSIASLHFMVCFFGAQIGVTANTEDQLKDIFLKEFAKWSAKLQPWLSDNIEQLDDFVRIKGQKDWFLRARVARPEKPEALAGLHGDYVLVIVDEASAVHDKVFEVMKGALTGENYLVIYTSNPTRTEGEFYKSHKQGAVFTKLHFNSRHSPIVKDGYIQKMEEDYPSPSPDRKSDEVLIRVDGEFAGEAEMDDKGWMPLFANVKIIFEPYNQQVLNRGIIGCDPAGRGRDSTIAGIRDHIYLKEVLNERTSSEPDVARKLETIRDAYNCSTGDIGVEAFGIGAKVVANVRSREDELNQSPMAILTDKAREETKDKFVSYKDELGWKFRSWCANGGIIITNNPKAWLNELEKIKYKRVAGGKIKLMSKVEFKKEYRFSPDRFDMACMTFFKDEPYRPVQLTKAQLEQKETMEWLQSIQQMNNSANDVMDQSYSSM